MTVPDKQNGDVSMFRPGQQVSGTILQIEQFGAFVQIAQGVAGLLEITEICKTPVRHPSAILSVGQIVVVEVLHVNVGQKKVSVSMKQLT